MKTTTSKRIKRAAALFALLACVMAVCVGCTLSFEASSAPNPASNNASNNGNTNGTSSISSPQTEALSKEGITESIAAPDAYQASEYEVDGYYQVAPDEMPWQEDIFNTEEYRAQHEPGFISVATRPLSTLSADVDTASYCNLRRMINDGYFLHEIPEGAVRIEEMLNYFDYDYARPAGDDLFATTVQVGDCPWNPDTKLLVMGFATAEEIRATDAGSNLVFLIDVSGSMDAPDKLDLLKDAFGELVDGLSDADRVSIVTYASGEEVVLEGAKGSDKRKIMRAIKRLQAGGSTNGEAGLMKAYDLAEKNFIEGGVNRIVLASDGDLNVGMTDESSLEAYVSKKRETGVYLSVLGFGSGNYKDNKMEVLADNGNGQYHYIDCKAEAQRVFGDKLTANLLPLANDVKLQVEFNPSQVKGYRLIGYENRALADEDFRDDTKDAGEVGPGHQFTVAYEVALVDSKQEIAQTNLKYSEKVSTAGEGSNEWLTCTMRYQNANGSGAREQSFVVDESAWTDSPNDDWRFAASVIEVGMLLRESEYAGDATLDDALALIGEVERDSQREEFADLVAQLA